MRVWLSQHMHTLATTLAKIAHAPVASLLNVGVIGVALALPVGFYLGLTNLQGYSGRLAPDPQLSLFLALDAGSDDVARIGDRLRQHPGVLRFRYVSRAQALADMKASTGLADVVDSLGRNPLPDAYVVEARDSAPQALEALRDELRRWPKVEHVQLDAAWARRLEAILRLGRLSVLMFATLLAFALVAIIFNTIRLQILTQREEIEVARLFGATDPYIRRPFLYYGAVLGFAGGLAAWLIVWLCAHVLNTGLAELSRLYGTQFELRQLTSGDSLSLLLFAAWLGWLGAWLSVDRHLSGIDLRQ